MPSSSIKKRATLYRLILFKIIPPNTYQNSWCSVDDNWQPSHSDWLIIMDPFISEVEKNRHIYIAGELLFLRFSPTIFLRIDSSWITDLTVRHAVPPWYGRTNYRGPAYFQEGGRLTSWHARRYLTWSKAGGVHPAARRGNLVNSRCYPNTLNKWR